MEKDIVIEDFSVPEKGHGSYWPLGSRTTIRASERG
jgi:hypothetical protein